MPRRSSVPRLRRRPCVRWSRRSRYYSFDLLYWYKRTNTDVQLSRRSRGRCRGVYLLYWYKSTNTDVQWRSCDERWPTRLSLKLLVLLVQKYTY